MSDILYSICMCNYNMSDTIEASLLSLLEQLPRNFEVVVVDDGSTDCSVTVLKEISQSYPQVRVFPLKRDRSRKLGATRNYSVQMAKGQYVILHLDCDDLFGPFIVDFTKIFHAIENACGRDVLVSGGHINMIKRSFFMSVGGYENIYRGEDRLLWSRMAARGAWIPLIHSDFITRLPKPFRKRFFKTVVDTFDHMVNDFRMGVSFFKYYCYEINKMSNYSFKILSFRLLLLPVAFVMSKFQPAIDVSDAMSSPEEFAAYRALNSNDILGICKRFGVDFNADILSSDTARTIFVGDRLA